MTIAKEVKNDKSLRKNLAEVYSDSVAHEKVAQIIVNHLTNKQDIRSIPLQEIDFSGVCSILDIGCGFGYFTRGLKGRIQGDVSIMGIDCHKKHEKFYLQTCSSLGLKGNFTDSGISVIEKIESDSVDLILCSYALYFFPEYIHQIARILKKDGYFIVITHSRPHMKEFTHYVKDVLFNEGIHCNEPLPYESLIQNFSNENGMELLSPWFGNIQSINYNGILRFTDSDYGDFCKYFNFKRSFFVPCKMVDLDDMSAIILEKLKTDLNQLGSFKISKEDIIYICKNPNS